MKNIQVILRFIFAASLLITMSIGTATAAIQFQNSDGSNSYLISFGLPTIETAQVSGEYLLMASALRQSFSSSRDNYSLNSLDGIDATQFGGGCSELYCQIIFLNTARVGGNGERTGIVEGRAVNISGAGVYESNVLYNLGTIDYTNKTFAFYTSPELISPVPEPSTLALMLAGFGLIGFKSHRRNKLSA